MHQVVAVDGRDGVGAGDVERPRTRARGDQRVAEADAQVAGLDLVRPHEPGREADEIDPALREEALVVLRSLVDDPPDARHHRGEVDLGAGHADAELLGPVRDVVGDLGGPDQGLGGDAPPRDSGAADRARVEQHDPRTAPARLERAGDARHAAADDRDVDGLARHACLRGAVRGAGLPR